MVLEAGSRILCLSDFGKKQAAADRARIAQMPHFRAEKPPSLFASCLFPPKSLVLPPRRHRLHFPIKVPLVRSVGQTLEGCRCGDLHPWDRRHRAGFLKGRFGSNKTVRKANLIFRCTRSRDAPSTRKTFPPRCPSSFDAVGFTVGNICSIRRKLAKLGELRGQGVG